MKRVVLAGLVVLILLGGVWKVWGDVLILKLTDSGIMQSLTDAVISTEVGRRIMGLDVEEGDELEVRGSGVIQSQADVVISAELSGRVVALGADEGDEVEAGTVLVFLFEKCALNDEDRGLAHHIRPFKALELNVAKIAQNGNLCGSSDFFALIFDLDDLRAAQAKILFKQFFPTLIYQISERGCRMGHLESSDDQVATNFVFVAVSHGYDLPGRDLALDIVPSL